MKKPIFWGFSNILSIGYLNFQYVSFG
jgi:hypothetical protein